jgi:hypothetical protein
MKDAYESDVASWPEAGFAGREASRNVLHSPAQEGAREGTMGSPTLLP